MKIIVKSILGLGITLSAIAVYSQPSYGERKFDCDQAQISTTVQSHWGELPMIRSL